MKRKRINEETMNLLLLVIGMLRNMKQTNRNTNNTGIISEQFTHI